MSGSVRAWIVVIPSVIRSIRSVLKVLQ